MWLDDSGEIIIIIITGLDLFGNWDLITRIRWVSYYEYRGLKINRI